MKCKYYILGDDGLVSGVSISTNEAEITRGNERQILSASNKECLNTLICLFSLKNNWNKEECYEPVYKVVFENGNKQEVYFFDVSNVPDNFVMFQGCIDKLVGESI